MSKNRNSRNPRYPPKFTKSSAHIKQIPAATTKSTYMKRKLCKSNVTSYEINGRNYRPIKILDFVNFGGFRGFRFLTHPNTVDLRPIFLSMVA